MKTRRCKNRFQASIVTEFVDRLCPGGQYPVEQSKDGITGVHEDFGCLLQPPKLVLARGLLRVFA